ncbi:hypothetical protein ACLOJK_018086 [Asimina triloba]
MSSCEAAAHHHSILSDEAHIHLRHLFESGALDIMISCAKSFLPGTVYIKYISFVDSRLRAATSRRGAYGEEKMGSNPENGFTTWKRRWRWTWRQRSGRKHRPCSVSCSSSPPLSELNVSLHRPWLVSRLSFPSLPNLSHQRPSATLLFSTSVAGALSLMKLSHRDVA